MKRDPILRISRSNLINVLKEVNSKNLLDSVDDIFMHAQKYQIRDRYFITSTAKKSKNLERTIAAETPIIEKFNLILSSVRIELKHKRVQAISKADSSYTLLKEVAKIAYDFAEDFDIVPREDGYKEFCKLGITMMGRVYALNKFKTYKQSIYEYFDSYTVVVSDTDQEGTLEFYSEWQSAMLEYTGLESQIYIDKDYKKYVHIIYGKQAADSIEAPYRDWIVAQFEGLAFLNAIPELSQFHGENSLKRYEKYLRNKIAEANNEESTEPELKSEDEELQGYFNKLSS